MEYFINKNQGSLFLFKNTFEGGVFSKRGTSWRRAPNRIVINTFIACLSTLIIFRRIMFQRLSRKRPLVNVDLFLNQKFDKPFWFCFPWTTTRCVHVWLLENHSRHSSLQWEINSDSNGAYQAYWQIFKTDGCKTICLSKKVDCNIYIVAKC